jgi:UDP-N-acetyl-D-mannosaminuronic acid transferase (WecB/TagA/CpsF family)
MCNSALEWVYRILQDPTLIWKKRFYQFATHFFLPVFRDALQNSVNRKTSIR